MFDSLRSAASAANEAVAVAGVVARLRLTELCLGPKAARSYYGKKWLQNFSADIMSDEDAARTPKFKGICHDVKKLAKAAGMPAPKVVLMHGFGSEAMNGSPAVLTRGILLIPQLSIYLFSRRQFKAIIAHELGHIANGDLDRAPLRPCPDSHDQEYEADRFAAELMGRPQPLIAVLEKFRPKGDNEAVEHDDEAKDVTHPPPAERIERLRRISSNRTEGNSRNR